MMKRLIKALCIIVVIFATQITYGANQPSSIPSRFISIADIHFDPFYDCSKANDCELLDKLEKSDARQWQAILNAHAAKQDSHVFQDTNYKLLSDTLGELAKVQNDLQPKFILLMGDLLAHDFRRQFKKYSKDKSRATYESFVKKVMQFITFKMNETFPHLDVYSIVGNNDSYHGNYRALPGSVFFKDMSTLWGSLIKSSDNKAKFTSEFSKAGYYEVNIPGSEANKLIVLNTILFSARYQNPAIKKAAREQLQWLEKELATIAANHQYAFIAFHIPIGIDVYATMQRKFKSIRQFWEEEYTSRFKEIIKKYHENISAILGAHIHIESLQMVADQNIEGVPVYITPSVSPNYGNNPSMKIFTYDDKTLEIDKADTYTYLFNK